MLEAQLWLLSVQDLCKMAVRSRHSDKFGSNDVQISQPTFVIQQGPIGSSNHLQHVRDRVVLIGMDFAVIVLRVHDNNELSL